MISTPSLLDVDIQSRLVPYLMLSIVLSFQLRLDQAQAKNSFKFPLRIAPIDATQIAIICILWCLGSFQQQNAPPENYRSLPEMTGDERS